MPKEFVASNRSLYTFPGTQVVAPVPDEIGLITKYLPTIEVDTVSPKFKDKSSLDHKTVVFGSEDVQRA